VSTATLIGPRASGMGRCVTGSVVPDVSEERSDIIFTVRKSNLVGLPDPEDEISTSRHPKRRLLAFRVFQLTRTQHATRCAEVPWETACSHLLP
jgi:hypothetical protein